MTLLTTEYRRSNLINVITHLMVNTDIFKFKKVEQRILEIKLQLSVQPSSTQFIQVQCTNRYSSSIGTAEFVNKWAAI
jgi:hypothetical protein